MFTVQGITYERLHALMDMHERVYMQELYDTGIAVNLAFHKPEDLKKFLPRPELDLDKIHPMLRGPRK